MGLFDIFVKKDVPMELPSLSSSNSYSKVPKVLPETSYSALRLTPESEESKYKKLPVQKMESWNAAYEKKKDHEKENGLDEKSFFRELIKDLTHEISSEKLNSNYKEKILQEDIVSQMKGYWENQKPEIFLQNAGKEIKEKLIKKAENLTELEKDWQGAYFSLIAKEEKIRQEEKELKQMLSELIGIYEKSLTNRSAKSKDKKTG